MFKKMHLTRARAFGLHFFVSGLIVASVFLVIFLRWYPTPFFSIDGGLRGVWLVALVDVVVGPVLTYVVFKPAKRGLKLDLCLIFSLQLTCLSYGVWTIYSNRPAALVFSMGSFHSVSISVYQEYGKNYSQILALSAERPPRIFVNLPEDEAEYQKFRKQIYLHGEPFKVQVDLYRPYDEYKIKVVRFGRDLNEFLERNPEYKKVMEDWLHSQGRPMEDYAFIPVYSRFQQSIFAVDAKTGSIVDYLDIKVPLIESLPYKNKTKRFIDLYHD